jgi:hypothetical protein
MEKVQAFGAPFLLEHSSCSNLKPKTFEWTNDDCPIKVFIDGGILPGLEYQKKEGEKKIAWVCESRSIFHTMHVPRDTWMNNLEKICEGYDVVFTSERELLSIHPKLQFAYAGSNLPWIKPKVEDIAIEKSKLCSIIASPKKYAYGHKLRHAIIETFRGNLDVYGGADNSPVIQGEDRWDKSQGLNDYMFSFVIENDSYSTYYTEKLTDCFLTGTIPIYWGAPDIDTIFDGNGIIKLYNGFDIKTLTVELFESKLESVYNNYNKCIELEMADDYLYNKIKQL